MNILTSYNWIKEYIKTDLSPEEFASLMSLKSMSIESITSLKEQFEGMVVGVVDEVKDHPNADKLKIAVTDIGKEKVEIVCGGSNLKKGMRVFVALPGSKVRWHGEGDLVELKETKIRGEKSFGMICAPSEVGFEKYPNVEGGIWDLGEITEAGPGTPIADALQLDDIIFDIEVTTNRPDAMNIIGLAREAGAVIEKAFDWKASELPIGASKKELHVKVKEPELCPRYMAVVIDGVKIGPSPFWLQQKLLLAGYKPINNIVDITNYILHEYGQPLHAFDYEKIEGAEIIIRKAKKDEKFLALDDIEYELKNSHLVIADKNQPIAIGGVMGGKESGTWGGTTTIVFEAAAFNANSVRRTARDLNLHSQSQSMFEKGLSTQSPEPALARAIELALEIAGGEVASEVVDVRASEYKPMVFPFRPQRARDLIGVDIGDGEMTEILQRLGFKMQESGDAYEIEVPYWRDNDVQAEVDFTEEIARMHGYNVIPAELPEQAPPVDPEDPALAREHWIKQTLLGAGYTEFYGNSFVSAAELEKYDLEPEHAVKIFNELTKDHTHMRPSLMPSLLTSIEMNQGETSSGNVFELQKVYIPKSGDLPDERTHLVLSIFGTEDIEDALLEVKGVIEFIARKTNLELSFVREKDNARWHFTRTASIKVNGEFVGTIGQVAEEYQQAFGIDKPVIAATMDLQDIIPIMIDKKSYVAIPEFPAVTRDIAILVSEFTEYGQMKDAISKQSPLIEDVALFDVYRGKGIPEGKKSVAISLTFRALDRTLSSEQVDDVMNVVKDVLEKGFDGTIR